MEKLKIVLNEYNYECGDGCCHNWGVEVSINGVELFKTNDDSATILEQVLKHLGYNPEITRLYNGE